MSFGTFHYNGGDLGRGQLITTESEFRIILPHIIRILQELYDMGNSRLPYKYAFEFLSNDSKHIKNIIDNIPLSKNVSFYETDGVKLFQIRGASGGVASSLICYLITGDSEK